MFFKEGNNCQSCHKRQNYCFSCLEGTCGITAIQKEHTYMLRDY